MGVDAVAFAQELIRRPSITPADEGALGLVQASLESIGFAVARRKFEDPASPAVDNLYARFGTAAPNFCFAGHTDVVPPGDGRDWRLPPFAAEIVDGALWGRGAADMKGAIAAFIAAAERVIAEGGVKGSISLLITGDEEGPAINGTRKVLGWLKERGEKIDHCLVGEPTSAARLGDMIKIGRRGSMNCRLVVTGRQGHAAYPDRSINPVHALVRMLAALVGEIDAGYERFQPSYVQATDLEVGNPAHNVVPARAAARFNIRFNPNWTPATLEARLRERLDRIAGETGASYELKATATGDAFLTRDAEFASLIAAAIAARTGLTPELSTSGGTSDARFIKDVAPVADFGLVGATIHQVDERCPVEDIRILTDIYADILRRYFALAPVRG
jgi:succinyl-diaminopimelate desuccinylase